MMSWFAPWRRLRQLREKREAARLEAEKAKIEAALRLREAEVLAHRAAQTSENLREHMRRNDFAAMVDLALRGGHGRF